MQLPNADHGWGTLGGTFQLVYSEQPRKMEDCAPGPRLVVPWSLTWDIFLEGGKEGRGHRMAYIRGRAQCFLV
jgi:hypothetical protein